MYKRDYLSYPDYNNPNFVNDISRKAEFNLNKIKLNKDNQCDNENFELANHQRLLKNFVNNYTPYKSLLLFHGVGVGKTCSGVTISESFRDTYVRNNKKIIIVRKSGLNQGWMDTIYDPEKGEYVNRSIIFKNWKEEAIDILGGTRCGKIPFKERSSLTPEQLAEQRTIRCYRLLYGILSFKGTKANGEDHEVANLPVLWRVTGTAFAPVGSALDQVNKRKKLMFTTTFSIDSKRQKKGGNVFYIPEISVNADANLEMSKEDMETLTVFQDIINTENAEVVDLYKAAKKGQPTSSDGESAKVVKQVEDPVEVLSN